MVIKCSVSNVCLESHNLAFEWYWVLVIGACPTFINILNYNMSLFATRCVRPFFFHHYTLETSSFVQIRGYAARKGTRERKRKAKVKSVVEKVGFIPHNQRDKEKFLANRKQRKVDDSWKGDPTDDVYVAKYFKWKVYPFGEAVQCHRETHHPDMYNQPNANLHVSIELDMQGEKKTRFLDNFTRIVATPHRFDHGEERAVIAFCKDPDLQQSAVEAGAQLSGGVELIKQIQNGQVSLQDFNFVVAHPEILPELVALRGLMKRKFPNPKAGTLDVDLATLVKKFMYGINYTAVKDEYEKDFGIIETVIGTLNMDAKHLEENYVALIKDVYTMKPRRTGEFFRRCLLWSPPSQEKLKVDHESYLDIPKKQEVEEDDDKDSKEDRIAL
ncbi:unnamed protein product [Acanthoscelides obtectus]|uniref:39S ribosomal protein L1, mitochondrial n=1 Tax=Acanthoscelides obtectus TaxID=200917 RepID=A0A9P0LYJ2_ACAOB|nr:unnamed protein product [Acanthoscelides obtectus]CAK1636086.1 39S ribosomal protein L1, mitochondrial [Acanthoscelides obtectus]